jgi:predicted methyltransferase
MEDRSPEARRVFDRAVDTSTFSTTDKQRDATPARVKRGPMRLLSASVLCGLLAALGACGGESPPPAMPTSAVPSGGGAAPAGAPTAAATEQHVTTVEVPPAIRAIVDAPDRDPDDKKLDAGRRPGELLAFAGIKPGMKVADLAAGGGYTTELLARAVGPTGVVYSQNNPLIAQKFAEKPWAARLAKPVNKNVVKVTREFDDPLPPEAKDLDAVVMVLFYHDTFWMKTDQAKMNAAIFRSLKPGGAFIVVDHSARPGTGTTEVQTLHRIDETIVKQQVPQAGFKLAAEADFLRAPDDKRDWNANPSAAGERRGTSDRFVLKFVKP